MDKIIHLPSGVRGSSVQTEREKKILENCPVGTVIAKRFKKQVPGLTLAKIKQYLSNPDIHLFTPLSDYQQKRILKEAKHDPDIKAARKAKAQRDKRRKEFEKRPWIQIISTPMGGQKFH